MIKREHLHTSLICLGAAFIVLASLNFVKKLSHDTLSRDLAQSSVTASELVQDEIRTIPIEAERALGDFQKLMNKARQPITVK